MENDRPGTSRQFRFLNNRWVTSGDLSRKKLTCTDGEVGTYIQNNKVCTFSFCAEMYDADMVLLLIQDKHK